MSEIGSVSLDAIGLSGVITAADVSALREQTFSGDGVITKELAEDIIDLDTQNTVQDSSWQDFYNDVLCEFIIEQSEPRGYITVENADWLMSCLEHDGRVQTNRGIELLVQVLDKSRWSPTSLVKFALAQVKLAVVDGEGPLRDGMELVKGVVSEAEVYLLRRILYAFGGDENMGITRQEAEVLFDINEMTSEAENDPDWSDLFSKAIANYVMCTSGYRVPPREEALKRETWREEHESSSGFISKMVSGGLKSVWNAYSEQSLEESMLARLEREKINIITAEAIDEDEADWLIDRIMRDGETGENEKALLAFIRAESPKIHPSLQPLLTDVA